MRLCLRYLDAKFHLWSRFLSFWVPRKTPLMDTVARFSQHAQCWLGCSEPPLEARNTAKKSSLYARQEEEEEGLPSTSGQTTAGDKRSTDTL